MTETSGTRSARLADDLDDAIAGFQRLLESLSPEQWLLRGANYPQRVNDEDEGRTVGVIAHHVAINGEFILERIQATLAGRPLAPVDFKVANAAHAEENQAVERTQVLKILGESRAPLVAGVRAITDQQLDQSIETPAGPLTIEARVERVLIGHLKGHRGSIEAAIR